MRGRLLFAAVLLGACAAPALAADLGAVEPAPMPELVATPTAPTWSGFYLGALLGYSSGDAELDGGLDGEIELDGVDGGVFVGANAQFDRFVVGVEADALASGLDGSAPISTGGSADFEQNWSGSLRGRAGIALDRFLLYGTGGVAATNVDLNAAGLGGDDATLLGWTAGGGAEALVAQNITARVEYRYADYEDKTFSLGGTGVDADLATHSVRAGVGVKF